MWSIKTAGSLGVRTNLKKRNHAEMSQPPVKRHCSLLWISICSFMKAARWRHTEPCLRSECLCQLLWI